jgi:hypothetical protein
MFPALPVTPGPEKPVGPPYHKALKDFKEKQQAHHSLSRLDIHVLLKDSKQCNDAIVTARS